MKHHASDAISRVQRQNEPHIPSDVNEISSFEVASVLAVNARRATENRKMTATHTTVPQYIGKEDNLDDPWKTTILNWM